VEPIGNVKEIHTDNSMEHLGQSFEAVLCDRGIKHTTTAPYSSYQNGKSEKTWCTITGTARYLLKDSDLPKTFWSFAVDYAKHLRNRSYQRLTGKTAYELFTGTLPDMRKVHNFGSQCTFY